MSGEISRRQMMVGGLAAGAAASFPLRTHARGGGLEVAPGGATLPLSARQSTSGPLPSPAPAASLPEPIANNPAYRLRVLAAAAREKQRHAAQLWRSDLVGVADFALPSAEPRLHFVNLEDGSMRSFLVAHGRGSDPEHDGWLKSFSNTPGSEATSRGSYLTCEWYTGKYGTSIRLVGLDQDNSRALDRAIVMHPAWYAAPDMIGKWGKLGRSEGCFAMAPDHFNEALWRLSGGRLLFADRIGTG